MRTAGINCNRETALALEAAGAAVESVHLERLLAGERDLDDFSLLVLPGGFSYGDHLGAGTLWANRLRALGEPLARFVAEGRPVLGICNGFQALLKLGLLQGGSLAANASGRFACRWVWLRRPEGVTTPLLAGVDLISLPIAHGEGRFVARDEETLARQQANGAVALVYCDAEGNPGPYPINPNGAEGDVAALCNVAGNVLGLMPHPERNAMPGQAPVGRGDRAGLAIFANAVRMARG
jgi:phosphoribosylformylglycinamidine synthase